MFAAFWPFVPSALLKPLDFCEFAPTPTSPTFSLACIIGKQQQETRQVICFYVRGKAP
jgi:hypothetical protein